MKNVFVATVFCLGLGACSNLYTYSKAGVDKEATHADMMACKSVMAPLAGDEAKDAFDQCMASKGYEKKVEKYHL